jgi:PAP2 superfamily
MKRTLAAFAVATLGLALTSAQPTRADVITEWDEKGTAFVMPLTASWGGPHMTQRAMTMVDIAMFDAVNAIEPKYRPYIAQGTVPPSASKETAAVVAATTVLLSLVPADSKPAADIQAQLAAYLEMIPPSEAKTAGIKIGQEAASSIIKKCASDGSNAPDAYRPKTKPGAYIPTALTVGSVWPQMKPFVLKEPSQFRPEPPPALDSDEFAKSYNELREFGGKASTKRSPEQTETASFWLMVGPRAYHPLFRQICTAKALSVVDCARTMALGAIALTDAYMAVYDAKYHYELWRPITAIRNGDTIGNPNTPRDATWQPIADTPLHPEYPCAHCILSGAVAKVIELQLGGGALPELSMTSTTMPDVTHRWTTLAAFTQEVANARIWAGFHYRFSTVVGTEMGGKVGRYVVETSLLPAK